MMSAQARVASYYAVDLDEIDQRIEELQLLKKTVHGATRSRTLQEGVRLWCSPWRWLLLWGYFAVRGMGRMASTTVALALLVGNVSVMVWLGFVSGFGQTFKRLLVAVLGCIILTSPALDTPHSLLHALCFSSSGVAWGQL